jgi:hypothetical protein
MFYNNSLYAYLLEYLNFGWPWKPFKRMVNW